MKSVKQGGVITQEKEPRMQGGRMIELDGPRMAPANGGKAERLVILIHGYGADGQDLIGLVPHWQRLLPSAAFVAPNAPERCALSPSGYQWFPITRLDPQETWRGVQAAAPLLDAFIDRELERHGLDESALALAGFSQGTMMALHVGLRRARPPAAIVGYSGALAGAEHLENEITAHPPVLLVHGDMDDMIPVQALHKAVQGLGVGHAIAPDGLALGGQFIADAFAGRFDTKTTQS
jgi:phospholipase/carboxylesterase